MNSKQRLIRNIVPLVGIVLFLNLILWQRPLQFLLWALLLAVSLGALLLLFRSTLYLVYIDRWQRFYSLYEDVCGAERVPYWRHAHRAYFVSEEDFVMDLTAFRQCDVIREEHLVRVALQVASVTSYMEKRGCEKGVPQ